MRLSTFTIVAMGAVLACGGEEADTGMPEIPDTTGAQTLQQEPEAPASPPQQQVAATQQMPMTTPAARATPRFDEPWTTEMTGTVSPGMARDEVVSVWGEPVTERMSGALTFMYFRNGCEVTCGTYDVVFLENGQVVDAIVRFGGHVYSGVSSSPAERVAEYTPPVPAEGNTESIE